VLNDIIHQIKVPSGLLDRPYLRPIYDDPAFIVRNLWRLYGGWYEGNPARLKPPPDADLAAALAALSGGASSMAGRAEELRADGRLDVACELAEYAWRADPGDGRVAEIRSRIYRERAEGESSLMAKAIYNAAARDSDSPQ
jgi:alkyl sulfatase BDS1-like metallo-beta-lactamase superfamily hydrolase